jgi:hypothetical protein
MVVAILRCEPLRRASKEDDGVCGPSFEAHKSAHLRMTTEYELRSPDRAKRNPGPTNSRRLAHDAYPSLGWCSPGLRFAPSELREARRSSLVSRETPLRRSPPPSSASPRASDTPPKCRAQPGSGRRVDPPARLCAAAPPPASNGPRWKARAPYCNRCR